MKIITLNIYRNSMLEETKNILKKQDNVIFITNNYSYLFGVVIIDKEANAIGLS